MQKKEKINRQYQHTDLLDVNIWEYDTSAYAYRNTIDDVFTNFFKKPVKLVYKGPTPRILWGNGAPDILGREQSTNFPDILPLLIANEASIVELNSRLRSKGHCEITIERLPPNITAGLLPSRVLRMTRRQSPGVTIHGRLCELLTSATNKISESQGCYEEVTKGWRLMSQPGALDARSQT